jgi:hypothetical protein
LSIRYGTVTELVVLPILPRLSVTVSVTLYVPAAAYDRLVVGVEEAVVVVPSPKFH